MAKQMFLSTAAPRLVIDPADSSLTVTPGCVTFSDPERATNAAGDNWRDAATARFVPTDPADLDAYDAVYRWAFARFPRYVWCDEAAMILPVRGGPRWGNTYLVQGAKRSLGHLACTQRPRDINRNLIANAAHVFVWPMPNPDDVRHVAELANLPTPVLAGALAELGPHDFLWCDLVTPAVTPCPAIRA